MNNSENNPKIEYKSEETPEKQLADFKDTMREFKRQEEDAAKLMTEGRQGFTNVTSHFKGVDPDQLTMEDKDMWEIVKTNLIISKLKDDKRNRIPADALLDIFREYKKSVLESGNSSREGFSAFIANRIGGPIGYEYLRRSDN